MLCDFVADKFFRKNLDDKLKSDPDPAMLEAMKNHNFMGCTLKDSKKLCRKFLHSF